MKFQPLHLMKSAALQRAFNRIVLIADEELRDTILGRFDAVLDDLVEQDAFGTEGQCDPRGDRRDPLD